MNVTLRYIPALSGNIKWCVAFINSTFPVLVGRCSVIANHRKQKLCADPKCGCGWELNVRDVKDDMFANRKLYCAVSAQSTIFGVRNNADRCR